ncbi:MAG: dihydroorotate dehydrogenase [Candidatus Omnitrophota bacterium]
MKKEKLKIRIGKETFKSPIWAASGTFGRGKEFEDFMDLGMLGAIVTKTVTLNEREGNKPPRTVETSSGLLNSIGLENKGVDHFIKEYLPELKTIKTKIVVSIAGSMVKEFTECAIKIMSGKARPAALEINLSCPNVSHGKTKYKLLAQDPTETEKIIRSIKKAVKGVIIAKLSPNVTDITEIAKAAEAGGADAVALVNTYMGIAIDPIKMKPILGNITGGLSGPAIKPLALKAVWECYTKIKIPIIGIGGIMTGEDAAEFILCGASAVQIGTANLVSADACQRITKELEDYLKKQKIKNVTSLVGKAH